MAGTVWFGDNLPLLKGMPDASVQLIYVDPPFNTGNVQRLRSVQSQASGKGQTGFAGKKYEHTVLSDMSYGDSFDDYLTGFLAPRLQEAHRLLSEDGTLYVHLDMREVHYAKVFLDSLFGRDCFINEIIWSYDYGGRGKRCWPKKHDNILMYVKNPEKYVFNWVDVDRIPYLAPDLVGPEKAARGKFPTDVWWQTIVPTNSKERTGYPTQKPIQILRRIIKASSTPEGTILDFFAGSGTTGVAAEELGRNWVLIDSNSHSISVIKTRLEERFPSADVAWKITSTEKK